MDASPLRWGEEEHLRQLFADGLESLDLTPGTYVERAAGGPGDYCELFRKTFGPVIAIRAFLAADPRGLRDFDRDFLAFAEAGNTGSADGAAEYAYPYALVVASTRRPLD